LPPNVQPIRAGAVQLSSLEDQSLDLRRLMATLRRRKAMIIGITVIGTLVAAVYAGHITPLYRAESMIVVEPERKKVLNIDQVAQNINPDWLTAQTEAAVVASRALADQAVVRLDLAHNPSFNPALRPPDTGLIGTAEQWLDWIIGKLRR